MRIYRFLLVALSLMLGACRDSKVEVYKIPKEVDPSAPTATAFAAAPAATPPAGHPEVGEMAGQAVPKAEGAGLTWTAPPEWQSKPGSGMRKATFIVGEGAELAVTAFPGDVGGELANINRWRGQLQVAPISEAERAGALTRLAAGGLQIAVADISGGTSDKPLRMLGAMVPYSGATWFFKLTGPDAVVAKAKPTFLAFLQTLQATTTTPTAKATPAMTAGSAVADMANTPVIKAEGRGLQWTAPAHWQSRPAVTMRKATYAVPGENGAVGDLSITAFPGAVGGELANLNRWRGQLQLPPLADADVASAVTRLTANGLNVTLVDFSGGPADKPARMLGAIVPYDGANWFFKLTGPVELVAKEKPAFVAFVQSLQPH